MSATTHPIDLEPIVSAPTDGRTFEGIIADTPNVVEIIRFDAGCWKVYRGTVPSPTPDTERPMTVWQRVPEGVYPTHWIKGTIGKHDNGTASADGAKESSEVKP